ncbi:MAG: class I SAM-dependent methyltransferase [Thermoflexales bacterium]
MYHEITQCRMCGCQELAPIIDLGMQALTGVFPRSRDERITTGPLELVKCDERAGGCGLTQLRHSYDATEMYGQNYGYRSGLNQSMVRHLHASVARIVDTVPLGKSDLVIDIGANDSTTLQGYPADGPDLVGIDPTGAKFRQHYPERIRLIPDFFSAATFQREFGTRRAKVITSIAMLYDLEEPGRFFQDVREVLADDGVWVFEQSYLPTMLRVNAYDTICHEHIEYYGLKQIKWLCDQAGFRILDVELNDINGGSFSVTVGTARSPWKARTERVNQLLADEETAGLHTLAPFHAFAQRVRKHRNELRATLDASRAAGKLTLGLGASTKGNVLLQYCGFSDQDIPAIGEVNPDKYGSFTPGTLIPILPETEIRARKPDNLLVLPWHFRPTFMQRERDFLEAGGQLLFPLPEIEFVGHA